MRFRNVYMGIGSLLVVLLWVLSDPNVGFVQGLPFGASTLATLILLLKTVLYVAVLHVSRRALMDYLDLESYFKKALESSTGSGLAVIGVGITYLAIAVTVYAAVV